MVKELERRLCRRRRGFILAFGIWIFGDLDECDARRAKNDERYQEQCGF